MRASAQRIASARLPTALPGERLSVRAEADCDGAWRRWCPGRSGYQAGSASAGAPVRG